MSELNSEQSKLMELMSQISEEQYCAGWMSGLEYALWSFVNSTGDFVYGLFPIPDHYRAELREASANCGGWIKWGDIDEGETFISLGEWEDHLKTLQQGGSNG